MKDKVMSVRDNVFKFAGSVQITDNIRKSDEGFLYCDNVIVGRTGFQKYLGRELQGMGFGDKEVVEVLREEHEVFSEETLYSALGKPVTEEHPLDDVTVDNIKDLGKGSILTKLWRDGDNQMANIVITDKGLINQVENRKKRELSLGYTTQLVREGNIVKQTNIIINHLAVLKYGRAGNAIIRDGIEYNEKGEEVMELDLSKILKDAGYSIVRDKKDDDVKDEEKKEKPVEKQDEEKVEDEKEETKKEVKDEVKEEEKEQPKKEDKKVDEEKEEKEGKKTMDKNEALKLLKDGLISPDEFRSLVGEKKEKSNIFTDAKTVDNLGASQVKINDYSGINGDELNKHLQAIHDNSFSMKELSSKIKDTNEIRNTIAQNSEFDIRKLMGGK